MKSIPQGHCSYHKVGLGAQRQSFSQKFILPHGGHLTFGRETMQEGKALVQESYCDHHEETSISIRKGLCESSKMRIEALMRKSFRILDVSPQLWWSSGDPQQSGKPILHWGDKVWNASIRDILLRSGTTGELDGLGLGVGATYSNMSKYLRTIFWPHREEGRWPRHLTSNSLNIKVFKVLWGSVSSYIPWK